LQSQSLPDQSKTWGSLGLGLDAVMFLAGVIGGAVHSPTGQGGCHPRSDSMPPETCIAHQSKPCLRQVLIIMFEVCMLEPQLNHHFVNPLLEMPEGIGALRHGRVLPGAKGAPVDETQPARAHRRHLQPV
jgi:hypothetical protein